MSNLLKQVQGNCFTRQWGETTQNIHFWDRIARHYCKQLILITTILPATHIRFEIFMGVRDIFIGLSMIKSHKSEPCVAQMHVRFLNYIDKIQKWRKKSSQDKLQFCLG